MTAPSCVKLVRVEVQRLQPRPRRADDVVAIRVADVEALLGRRFMASSAKRKISGLGFDTPTTVESTMTSTLVPAPSPTWQMPKRPKSRSTVPSAFGDDADARQRGNAGESGDRVVLYPCPQTHARQPHAVDGLADPRAVGVVDAERLDVARVVARPERVVLEFVLAMPDADVVRAVKRVVIGSIDREVGEQRAQHGVTRDEEDATDIEQHGFDAADVERVQAHR